jgi:aminoglycoside phosphotransferase (APT) family kinase protein
VPDRREQGGVPMTPEPHHLPAGLVELARAALGSHLGPEASTAELRLVTGDGGRAVVVVSLAGQPRFVLKLLWPDGSGRVDLARTAAVMALARGAGVPVPETVAVGAIAAGGEMEGRWQYLLQEHLPGIEWRRLRPTLDRDGLAAAHRDIARALVRLQSVRFPGFGELDAGAAPAATDLVTSLGVRAELRVGERRHRALFAGVLERSSHLFDDPGEPTLVHDDLHHDNLIFDRRDGQWQLRGVLDWDKAWAGPAESDVARLAFWDDMTGPAFWPVYRAGVPERPGEPERRAVHQLLWCLEYDDRTPRHRRDTARLCRRLGVSLEER